jgi:hypothetical protein
MKLSEFEHLKPGDVIKNKYTKAYYVIVPAKMKPEPCTQKSLTSISTNIDDYEIAFKKVA